MILLTAIGHNSDKAQARTQLREAVSSASNDFRACWVDNDGYFGTVAELRGEFCGAYPGLEMKAAHLDKIVETTGTCWQKNAIEEDAVSGMIKLERGVLGVCTYSQDEKNQELSLNHNKSEYVTAGAWDGENVAVTIISPDGYFQCKGTSENGEDFQNWEC